MRRIWPDPADIEDIDAFVAAEPRPAPDRRPWLLVNMIASLDGAIAVSGQSGALGRPADRLVFSALRAIADVVLAGAGTVRAENYGPCRPTEAQRSARRARGQAEVPPIAVISRSLDLDPGARLFSSEGPRPILLTCDAAPAERRRALDAVADVVVAGHDDVDIAAALEELSQRGAAVVTGEGGPRLNADLIAADVVDEWALSVTPLLTGGTEGRASTGVAPPSPRGYCLDRLLEGDGIVLGRWLRQAD